MFKKFLWIFILCSLFGNTVQAQTQNNGSVPITTYNLDNIIFVDGIQYLTIQSAITAASTTKTVVIPPTYAGLDSFTNPDSITIIDLRSNKLTVYGPQVNKGNLTTNLTGGGTQCVEVTNAGLLTGYGAGCGSASLSFPVTVSGTTHSGAVACFTSTTNLASSAAFSIGAILAGGGPGSCPVESSIADNGTKVSTAEKVQFTGLATPGTISGSMCQDSSGNVLYNASANCFAGANPTLNQKTVGGTYDTTSSSLVSTGIGTAALTPSTFGNIFVSGSLYSYNSTSGDLVIIGIYRTTGSVPSAGSAPGGSDTLVFDARYGDSSTDTTYGSVNALSFMDTGLSTSTAYKYYIAIAAGEGGHAYLTTASGNSILQATEVGTTSGGGGGGGGGGGCSPPGTSGNFLYDTGSGCGDAANLTYAGGVVTVAGHLITSGLLTSGTVAGSLCADSSGNVLNLTIPCFVPYYQTVQNAMSSATQRHKLNFYGTGVTSVTDDSGNDSTDVEITAAAGTGCATPGTATKLLYDTGSGCGDATNLVYTGGGLSILSGPRFKAGSPWSDVTAAPYSAVGDGTTSNATAFTNALGAVASGLTIVPQGSFKLGSSVTASGAYLTLGATYVDPQNLPAGAYPQVMTTGDTSTPFILSQSFTTTGDGTSNSAAQSLMAIQAESQPTSSAAFYQKNGLFVSVAQLDPSEWTPSVVGRDLVAIQASAGIFGTTTGSIWGGVDFVTEGSGADGLAIGREIDSVNSGLGGNTLYTPTEKIALLLVAQGTYNSTVAMLVNDSGPAFLNGIIFGQGSIYSTDPAIVLPNANGLSSYTASAGTSNVVNLDGSNNLQVGDSGVSNIVLNAHLGSVGSEPSLSGCGTSPSLASNSTDMIGYFEEGTGATGCTVTFAHTWTTAPFCIVGNLSNVTALTYGATTTALTLSNTVASDYLFVYHCVW